MITNIETYGSNLDVQITQNSTQGYIGLSCRVLAGTLLSNQKVPDDEVIMKNFPYVALIIFLLSIQIVSPSFKFSTGNSSDTYVRTSSEYSTSYIFIYLVRYVHRYIIYRDFGIYTRTYLPVNKKLVSGAHRADINICPKGSAG